MVELDIYNLPFEEDVFDSLRKAKSNMGIFQLAESKTLHFAHMYNKVTKLMDLSDLTALIRPGMADNKDENNISDSEHYIRRGNGEEKVEYSHEAFRKTLEKSNNTYLYQEDAIVTASEIAGFDLCKADLLRQAIGKKKVALMASLKDDFIKGCKECSGVPEEIAEAEFERIAASGRYCLAGHETIYRTCHNKRRGGFKPNIEEMYRIKTDIKYAKETGHLELYKKYKSGNLGNCYSLGKDNRLYKNKVKDIHYAGKQKTYLVTLDGGNTIECTENHKFPTTECEKKLKDIKIGDSLYICLFESYKQGKTKMSRTLSNTKFRIDHKDFPCDKCGLIHKRMELHHIDGNYKNNKVENFTWLCSSCYKKTHYAGNRTRMGELGKNTHIRKIIDIKEIGVKDTYNVEIYHNTDLLYDGHTFVTSGGIVTSNSFNRSHAVAYSYNSYIDLYFRYYYPHLFYATNISQAMVGSGDKEKRIKKIKGFIKDAKDKNIETVPPDISRRNIHTDFSEKDNLIFLGFNCISGVGIGALEKIFSKIKEVEEEYGDILSHNWFEVLLYFSKVIGKKAMIPFISIGIFDIIDDNRCGLLYDYEIFLGLKDKELKWLKDHKFDNLFNALNGMVDADVGKNGCCSSEGRKNELKTILKLLNNRQKNTNNIWKTSKEENYLGISLTRMITQSNNSNKINIRLNEFNNPRKDCYIGVYIKDVKIKQQKNNGEDFAFLTCVDDDNNESSDVVIFSDGYKKYQDYIYQGATLLLNGNISDRGSFIVNKVEFLEE